MSLLSYGYNVRNDRLRVMGLHELLAFLLLIAVVCWMIFPRELSTSLRSARLDAVTLSYMQAWLKAKPDDDELRLLLARELIMLGHFTEAEAQLSIIERDGHSHGTEVAWLRLKQDFSRLMAIVPENRDGTMLQYQTIGRIQAMDRDALTLEQQEELAGMAMAVNESDIAAETYTRIAREGRQPDLWHERAARVYLANGDYQQASQAWVRAMAVSNAEDQRKAYFLSAIAALEAGSFHDDALSLAARREAPFLHDKAVLYRLMLLAQAGGDMSRAQRYGILLLNLPGARQLR